jgi:sec-independent protein translocase protein TatC
MRLRRRVESRMERKVDGYSFWGHLEDLRRKMLWVLGFALLAFLGCYFFLSRQILEALVGLTGRTPYYLSVFEPFLSRLRVSAWAAAFASVPLAVVQAIRFVSPGLRRGEKSLFLGVTLAALLLVIGAGYVLYRFSPVILSLFLDAFASPSIEMRLSISTFITFYLMLAGSALVIVLIPVATFLLLKLGVLKLSGVAKARRYLVPLFLFIAAVITPPDPASMIIVFIPLWAIFELSLLLFRLLLRRQVRQEKQEQEGD